MGITYHVPFDGQLITGSQGADVTHENSLPVHLMEPETGFGELQVAALTPIIQLQFAYSVNPRLVTSLQQGSGASSVSGSLLTLSTGTTTASDVLLSSVEDAKYHPGQGSLTRFTAVFQAGTGSTDAIIGIGNEEDGFFFGNNGTAFGVLHRFAGKVEYRTLTFTTGAVTAGGTVTVTLDGDATETEVTNGGSVQAVAREVGATTYVGWETQVIGASVIFVSHIAEAKAGAFTFADTDTTGVLATAGVVQSITGVAPTDTWVAQTAWNVDTMDGDNDSANPSGVTLDKTNGNVYEVQFQWLGFGAVRFFVERGDTGRFVHVHTIQYANANTTPSMQNPTLPLHAAVRNKGTTTDITVKSSSMAAFTEGVIDESNQGIPNSAVGSRSGFDFTTETSVLAIKSKPIFQSVENRVDWAPKVFTVSGNGAGAAKFTTIRATVNPVLGGDPSFTDISTTTSIISFDVAGTTVSGGSVVATFEYGADFTDRIDLTSFTVNQPPGTLVVFTAEIDGGTSDIDMGLIWRELF